MLPIYKKTTVGDRVKGLFFENTSGREEETRTGYACNRRGTGRQRSRDRKPNSQVAVKKKQGASVLRDI